MRRSRKHFTAPVSAVTSLTVALIIVCLTYSRKADALTASSELTSRMTFSGSAVGSVQPDPVGDVRAEHEGLLPSRWPTSTCAELSVTGRVVVVLDHEPDRVRTVRAAAATEIEWPDVSRLMRIRRMRSSS